MALLPPDHPERFALAGEAHARPPQPVATPSRASYLAVLIDAGEHERERSHLAQLCERFGVAPPPPGASHFSERLGELRITWERHGEFCGCTLHAPGLRGEPFDEPPASLLPAGWLEAIPGRTLVAVHAWLIPATDATPDAAGLARLFDGNAPAGGEIGDGAGLAFSDFRVHADGFGRIAVYDRGFTPHQAGRMLQRLFEIEAYRMLALLALPIARHQLPRIVGIEKSLAALTDGIARGGGNDEDLLQTLTRLAAEVESALAAGRFRFGACRAYDALVRTRIAELRERRIPGIPPIEEFMARRFAPAVATCATVSSRLHELSERVAQVSGLLSTRVEIARERQNQALDRKSTRLNSSHHSISYAVF